MKRPRLVVITGSPASGKITLSTKLSQELCLPLIARDPLKGGLVFGGNVEHNPADPQFNLATIQDAMGFLYFFVNKFVLKAGRSLGNSHQISLLEQCQPDSWTKLDFLTVSNRHAI
ncbi:MAG: hypothetical protein HRT45_08705 [Bdellovibrionales bacterium]|nr:hypothetical protein [Bdellovibrionales bacterium]